MNAKMHLLYFGWKRRRFVIVVVRFFAVTTRVSACMIQQEPIWMNMCFNVWCLPLRRFSLSVQLLMHTSSIHQRPELENSFCALRSPFRLGRMLALIRRFFLGGRMFTGWHAHIYAQVRLLRSLTTHHRSFILRCSKSDYLFYSISMAKINFSG